MTFIQKYSFVISRRIVQTSRFWTGRGNCQEVLQKYILFTLQNVKKTDKIFFIGVFFSPQSVFVNISKTFAMSCWVRPMLHVPQLSVYCGGTRRCYVGRVCCPVFAVHFPHAFQQPWLLYYRCPRLFHLVSIYGHTKPDDGTGMLLSPLMSIQVEFLHHYYMLISIYVIFHIVEYNVFNIVKIFLNLIIFQCEEI